MIQLLVNATVIITLQHINVSNQHTLLLSHFSRVQLCATPQTGAHQAPLSIGFSRQEYWSGLPCPFPGDLPDPGIKPTSPSLQADSLPSELPSRLLGKIGIMCCSGWGKGQGEGSRKIRGGTAREAAGTALVFNKCQLYPDTVLL